MFLKLSRLVPRRSLAQEFCDAGLVKLNGSIGKSSKEVKAGDEISISRRNRITTIMVANVPDKKQIARSDAASLYSLISEKTIEDLS